MQQSTPKPDTYSAEEAAWILTHCCGPCDKFRLQTQTCHCYGIRNGTPILGWLRTGTAGCPRLNW